MFQLCNDINVFYVYTLLQCHDRVDTSITVCVAQRIVFLGERSLVIRTSTFAKFWGKTYRCNFV